MPIFKSSVSIEASPEATFAYVRDVRNLPRFLERLTAAAPTGDDTVTVTEAGSTNEARFRVKDGHHPRIEWSVEGTDDYHGWLEVDPEGEVCSVTAEIHLPGDHGGVDEALDRALFALKAQVEGS